jgi:adenylate cyclase class IV
LVPIDTSKEAKYQLAIQLKEDGLTYEQIAQKLGYKDKSSVTKLIQSYESKKKSQNG